MVSYSAFWGGVGIPALIVVGLMLIPYLDRNPNGEGYWFHRSRYLAVFLVYGVYDDAGDIDCYWVDI